MPEEVEGWQGAPQSIYSDAYLWPDDPSDQRIGYELEVTPLQPVFALANFDKSMGASHAALVKRFPHMHSQIALMRYGFDPQSTGGRVELQDAGSEALGYPVGDHLRGGFR